MTLPEVCAGPLLRRAEPGRVLVWLATSRPLAVRGEVFALEQQPHHESPRRAGWGSAQCVRLGPRLYVHLVSMRPDPAIGRFPTDRLLGYDLALGVDDTDDQPLRHLADLGLLTGPRAITVGGLPLPSFFLRGELRATNLLHGSCRLLHGLGEDALLAADELLAESAATSSAGRAR
jgi:hypothetical protein